MENNHPPYNLLDRGAHIRPFVSAIWRQGSITQRAKLMQSHPEVSLRAYDQRSFSRGRSRVLEALWIAVQAILVKSWVPGSTHRVWLLRTFGARVGKRVNIKPGVRVKFPWRLEIADDVWIGEGAWIDNLAEVKIAENACISQGAYLCTGNHDWGSSDFKLKAAPITIGRSAWIAAMSRVGPGVSIGNGAVLLLGGVAYEDLEAFCIYSGNPARPVKIRKFSSHKEPHG